MGKEEATKKIKCPTAKKRAMQAQKRRIRNKAFRSQTRNLLREFSEPPATPEKLSRIYSMLDKGVKKGIFNRNLAGRLKSRFARRPSQNA